MPRGMAHGPGMAQAPPLLSPRLHSMSCHAPPPPPPRQRQHQRRKGKAKTQRHAGPGPAGFSKCTYRVDKPLSDYDGMNAAGMAPGRRPMDWLDAHFTGPPTSQPATIAIKHDQHRGIHTIITFCHLSSLDRPSTPSPHHQTCARWCSFARENHSPGSVRQLADGVGPSYHPLDEKTSARVHTLKVDIQEDGDIQ